MKISSAIKTFKTYSNPIWFYLNCYGFNREELSSLSLRNGLKFYFRPRKNDLDVIHEIYFNNIYDLALDGLNPESSVVIDIGGHIGTFSLLVSRFSKKVYVYEPEWENLSILRKNVQINKVKNIKSFHLGITSKSQKRALYVSSTNSSCSSLFEGVLKNESKNISESQLVTCVSLKNEILKNKIKEIDLIKIDCEGAEFEILMSLPANVYSITKRIIFEYHDWSQNDLNHKDLIKILGQKGYEVVKVDQKNETTGTLFAWRN